MINKLIPKQVTSSLRTRTIGIKQATSRDLKVIRVRKAFKVRKVKLVLLAKKVTREILLKLQLLVEKMATVLTLHLHFLEKSLL